MANILSFVYSDPTGLGTNTDPKKSLGGVPSVNPIQGTTIFDNVASEQASSGVVQYRCIYVTNDSPSNNVYGTNLYISEDVALGADIDLGFKIANERQIVKVVNFSTVTGGYLDVTYTRDTSYPFTVAYDSSATTFADTVHHFPTLFPACRNSRRCQHLRRYHPPSSFAVVTVAHHEAEDPSVAWPYPEPGYPS